MPRRLINFNNRPHVPTGSYPMDIGLVSKADGCTWANFRGHDWDTTSHGCERWCEHWSNQANCSWSCLARTWTLFVSFGWSGTFGALGFSGTTWILPSGASRRLSTAFLAARCWSGRRGLSRLSWWPIMGELTFCTPFTTSSFPESTFLLAFALRRVGSRWGTSTTTVPLRLGGTICGGLGGQGACERRTQGSRTFSFPCLLQLCHTDSKSWEIALQFLTWL